MKSDFSIEHIITATKDKISMQLNNILWSQNAYKCVMVKIKSEGVNPLVNFLPI